MMPLSSAQVGTTLIVAELHAVNDASLRKLMALGIVPGAEVILEQRFPSYVLKVGRTRAALDQETVCHIFVKPSLAG